jgi:hypothetical protein
VTSVYVDVHSTDVDVAEPLTAALVERQIAVTLGAAGDRGAPAARLAALETRIAESQLVFLVYGDVSREWAAQRFTWIDQLLCRLELATRVAIFTPRRKTPAELSFNFRARHPVLDAEDGLLGERLDALLEGEVGGRP